MKLSRRPVRPHLLFCASRRPLMSAQPLNSCTASPAATCWQMVGAWDEGHGEDEWCACRRNVRRGGAGGLRAGHSPAELRDRAGGAVSRPGWLPDSCVVRGTFHAAPAPVQVSAPAPSPRPLAPCLAWPGRSAAGAAGSGKHAARRAQALLPPTQPALAFSSSAALLPSQLMRRSCSRPTENHSARLARSASASARSGAAPAGCSLTACVRRAGQGEAGEGGSQPRRSSSASAPSSAAPKRCIPAGSARSRLLRWPSPARLQQVGPQVGQELDAARLLADGHKQARVQRRGCPCQPARRLEQNVRGGNAG